jgi:DNA-binding MurR/RpiR family transcriptional regulator
MESVFNKPIAQLTQEAGISKVAWVRFCKNIGFDGLRDLKVATRASVPTGSPAAPIALNKNLR